MLRTTLERLKFINSSLTKPHEIALSKRWCSGGICACLGCANLALSHLFSDKTEWQDYQSWKGKGMPEHTNISDDFILPPEETSLVGYDKNKLTLVIATNKL